MYTIIILIALLTSCGGGMEAVNTLISRQPIPGTALDVVIFDRDAGATTGFSKQISIIVHGQELLNDGGNVFICDKVDKVAIDVSDRKLVIRHSKSARIFKNIRTFNGVEVTYIIE